MADQSQTDSAGEVFEYPVRVQPHHTDYAGGCLARHLCGLDGGGEG